MQKRSVTLIKRVDANIESILTQFAKIIELSSILDKSQTTLSVESLQIEANSSTIIRLTEELLSITRNLKESWILGQIPTDANGHGQGNNSTSVEEEDLDVKMNKLLNLIIRDDEDNETEMNRVGIQVTYADEELKKQSNFIATEKDIGDENIKLEVDEDQTNTAVDEKLKEEAGEATFPSESDQTNAQMTADTHDGDKTHNEAENDVEMKLEDTPELSQQ